jgi:hypothetical protein
MFCCSFKIIWIYFLKLTSLNNSSLVVLFIYYSCCAIALQPLRPDDTSKMRTRRTLLPPSPGPLDQCGTHEPERASGYAKKASAAKPEREPEQYQRDERALSCIAASGWLIMSFSPRTCSCGCVLPFRSCDATTGNASGRGESDTGDIPESSTVI